MRPTTRRLPAFFSNLLPEGHLRTYLAEKAGINPEREFFLMAVLGADLSGAVTVRPHADDTGGDDRAREDDDDDHHDHHEDDRDADVLRFSLAGVQLKFSAVMESHGGLTIPAYGVGGSWIAKLPATQHEAVPENELAMLALARAVGIETPEARLVTVSEIEGLPKDAARMEGMAPAVQRFDRGPDGAHVHMEDFAQVFGTFPDGKYKGHGYANIAQVLWAETSPEATYEFVRRLVFSVVTGNGDMHQKNWSLLYPDGRTPTLSPAYDLVSTLPDIPGDSLAVAFGGSRGLQTITLDQVRRFADKARLPGSPVWQIVQETRERTIEAWKTLPEKDLIPAATRTIIDKQIETTAVGL